MLLGLRVHIYARGSKFPARAKQIIQEHVTGHFVCGTLGRDPALQKDFTVQAESSGGAIRIRTDHSLRIIVPAAASAAARLCGPAAQSEERRHGSRDAHLLL